MLGAQDRLGGRGAYKGRTGIRKLDNRSTGLGEGDGAGRVGQAAGLREDFDGGAKSEQKKRMSLQRGAEFKCKHMFCLRC